MWSYSIYICAMIIYRNLIGHLWTTPHLPRSVVLCRWCLRRTILLADAWFLQGAALAARGLHQNETPRLASYIFQNTTIGYYMRLCGLIRFIYLIIFAMIIYKKTSLGMCGQHMTTPHLPRSAVLCRWCLRSTILLADAWFLPGAALAARGLHQKETPRLVSYIFQNTIIGYYMRLCGLIRFIYLIIFAIIIYKKTSLGMCGQHPISQDQLSSASGA